MIKSSFTGVYVGSPGRSSNDVDLKLAIVRRFVTMKLSIMRTLRFNVPVMQAFFFLLYFQIINSSLLSRPVSTVDLNLFLYLSFQIWL